MSSDNAIPMPSARVRVSLLFRCGRSAELRAIHRWARWLVTRVSVILRADEPESSAFHSISVAKRQASVTGR